MVDLMQSDAIYWFCDFDDPHDDNVIRQIARNVRDKKARLYVHTLARRPPDLIKLLAEKSGGAVMKKRM